MAAKSSHRPLNDWPSLATATHSFTTHQLQQYNAAGGDPYLIQIAELLGSQFNISLQGQRNLANAFSSLPQAEFYGQRMGIGFSDRHLARILLESDNAFAFLSVLGCLGEYFAEDVVVAVIMELVKSFSRDAIPEPNRPDDFQWKRLVHLCQGVLATSPFGTMVSRNHEIIRTETEHVSVSTIAKGLVSMSSASRYSSERVSLEHAGSDAFWFAAVAEYLFDLRVNIQDGNGEQIYFQPGVDATNAQVRIRCSKPLYSELSPEQWPLARAFPDICNFHGSFPVKAGIVSQPRATVSPVRGGRVTWDKLFRSCFGRTFTDIDSSLIAGFIGCAASLTTSALRYSHKTSQEIFLPHASTIRGLSGHGLVETVTSWFPELRRMAPQMGKFARLPFQEARNKCDEFSAALESGCMCSSCGNAPATSIEFCKHSVVEVIMDLGLFIARTVVIPNLFPKRQGILAFYERHHAAGIVYRAQKAPDTEAFLQGFVLPTPRDMVESMCMVFTGSVPKTLMDSTLAISHEGATVSLTAWTPSAGVRDPENDHIMIRQRAGVNVSTGSSHLFGRISDHAYWVPFASSTDDSKGEPLSLGETLEFLRTKPKESQTDGEAQKW